MRSAEVRRRVTLSRGAVVAVVVVALVGCSASVGGARPPSSTAETSTTVTGSSDGLVRHLAAVFTAMNQSQGAQASGVDPAVAGTCTARELIRREGGAAGLAKLGIGASSTQAQVGASMDRMLQQRVLGSNVQAFDSFVDAMFACGLDKRYRSEFITQLEADGNSRTASECLASRVLSDRYLRLVLIVGTPSGSTTDPQVKTKFEDPLVRAVDRAAKGCGVSSWGGS